MTAYGQQSRIAPSLALAVRVASEKRRKVLEAVRHRRKLIYAERFIGLFKLAVAERQPYRTLGEFLRAAQQWVIFYNTTRPHESLGYRSPEQYAHEQQLGSVPSLTLF